MKFYSKCGTLEMHYLNLTQQSQKSGVSSETTKQTLSNSLQKKILICVSNSCSQQTVHTLPETTSEENKQGVKVTG